LIQADNQRHLATMFGGGNRGDANDLYPYQQDHGAINRTLGQATRPPLNFPDNSWTGVTIQVRGNAGDPEMAIDVSFSDSPLVADAIEPTLVHPVKKAVTPQSKQSVRARAQKRTGASVFR